MSCNQIVPEYADVRLTREEIQFLHGLRTGKDSQIYLYELELEDEEMLACSILDREEVEELVESLKKDIILLDNLLSRIPLED